MALTCEIMKIDNIFLLYKNSEQYFPTYDLAYYNSKKSGCSKQVYYVFTPTMQEFKYVNEIENCARKYFNSVNDCDFYDVIHHTGFKQLSII